jgi:DNA-binding MarR family transcriptional regulator
MSRKPSRYSLNESLGYIASQASRRILKRINQELSRQGYPLSSEQFQVLAHLFDQNGQPQFILADSLNKDRSALAKVVSSLETLGFVTRRPGQRDAREKVVFLTESGEEVIAKSTDLVQDILDAAQEGIEERDIRICKEVLRRFYRQL